MSIEEGYHALVRELSLTSEAEHRLIVMDLETSFRCSHQAQLGELFGVAPRKEAYGAFEDEPIAALTKTEGRKTFAREQWIHADVNGDASEVA